ncbi:KPN_02809 family neutral zinc metallopeptidase [Sphingomonas bacterium]|uniref:KPN_02809 family neutral zinc metallopeptidase n=1 Tax=Sphingomonas bacterium TaxID=1895847 RepID=UPI0015753EA0|nr:neutral zinc metallopeptidase [Sphingomonas bacterium]
MRLDDFDPDINVGDQRGQGGGGFLGGRGGGGGGGLLLGLLPLIGSRFGCGGIVLVVIVLAVLGVNPLSLLGGGNGNGGGFAPTQRSAPAAHADASRACNLDASSKAACNAFSSADKTWAALFAHEGKQFQAPSLQFYSRDGQSGCGAAQAAMGPFYCPTDDGIYLDTSFFQELQTRFHAGGDFAQDYVIAHEFGHHIQNLLGISAKVSQAEQSSSATDANKLSVKLELQADCYAGVWANANKDRLDPGDVQEGLTAAHAIGDDTLQQEAQGRVVPDSFTHGTSAQREHWLQVGLDSGDPARCDTFDGAI